MSNKKDTITFVAKPTEIQLNEKESADYSYFLRAALRHTDQQSGMGVEVMRKRIKVLDKLEDVNIGGKVELTQEEVNVVKASVSVMAWGFVDRDIIAFSDYIESL